MKTIFAFTLLLALTVTLTSPLSLHAQRKTSASRTRAAATPEQVARNFYSWYVGALNRNQRARPLQQQRTTARKYVTARLLKEINDQMSSPEGINVDPFLDAQDWDNDWARNITTTKVKQDETDATVDVTLDGKQMPKHRLQVMFKREGGSWKIDSVKGMDA